MRILYLGRGRCQSQSDPGSGHHHTYQQYPGRLWIWMDIATDNLWRQASASSDVISLWLVTVAPSSALPVTYNFGAWTFHESLSGPWPCQGVAGGVSTHVIYFKFCTCSKINQQNTSGRGCYIDSCNTIHDCLGYGVTANIAASHTVRGSSGFDSPYPNFFFPWNNLPSVRNRDYELWYILAWYCRVKY